MNLGLLAPPHRCMHALLRPGKKILPIPTAVTRQLAGLHLRASRVSCSKIPITIALASLACGSHSVCNAQAVGVGGRRLNLMQHTISQTGKLKAEQDEPLQHNVLQIIWYDRGLWWSHLLEISAVSVVLHCQKNKLRRPLKLSRMYVVHPSLERAACNCRHA